jgi:hypothetical protein
LLRKIFNVYKGFHAPTQFLKERSPFYMQAQAITSIESGVVECPAIQSLQSFCRAMGITAITAWRFRKRGWLETINIAGRVYITSEGVAKFKQRAASGEFAKEHKAPGKASVTA